MKVSEETMQDFLTILPAVLYEYVLYEDRSSEFLYMSPTAQTILECPAEYFVEDTANFWSMVHPDDVSKLYNDDVSSNIENDLFVSEIRLILPSNNTIWVQLSSRPTSRTEKGCLVWSGYIIDISEGKSIEEERDKLVTSLEKALDEVKTLRGGIPVCKHCHAIQKENGAWDKFESYISNYSDTMFSHDICPACLEKTKQ